MVSPMRCGQCRGFLCCGTGCAVWHGVVCWLSLLSPSLLCFWPTSTPSCRARFLENLAAAQKEKISSMAKGRLDVLSDTTLEHPTALAWERDHGTSDPGVEPPSISRCCRGVCSQLIWVPGWGLVAPQPPSHACICDTQSLGGAGHISLLKMLASEHTSLQSRTPTPH